MIRILSILLILGLPLASQAFEGDYVWEDKFKKALPKAESGDVKAQYSIGKMYEAGKGVDKDRAKAFQWYTKAAKQGDKKGAYKVGVSYLKGKGVSKNSEKAMKWLTISSKKGYARAHYYLGEMYEKGIGVSQNFKKAISWYKKSKDGGYALAEDRIKFLKDEIKDSERRADKAAAANARRRLSTKKPKARTVSRKTPAVAPPSLGTKEVLLKGGWNKRSKPAEYLPSSATKCKKVGKTIECTSKDLKRNIGMADIKYTTKAIIFSIKPGGDFKISYRNNVKKITVTDPEFIESGAKVPVKKGWQDAEHKLICTIDNERAITCRKDRLRKVKFNR